MCGIAGIYNLHKKSVKQAAIKAMTDEIAHRGPDDAGFYLEDNLALGHRRLSILDLSPLGHQPMFFDHNNLVIVFNGEVYNYLEIRNVLKLKGYKFKSESDTEVILAAYKEWGPECLSRFNGMWAFIIYDHKKKTFFGARDRLGIKPLYYFIDKEKILFASEVKAILKYPGFKPLPEEKTIWDFLITGLNDHAEKTFFKGINQLKAGHYFLIERGKMQIKKYWDLDLEKKEDSQKAVEKFKEIFEDSIKLRLRSDVPIGTCLSGGLDSSSIVSTINDQLKNTHNEQVGKWQKTFSAVYDRQGKSCAYDPKKYPSCDEQKFIELVVRKTHAKSYLTYPNDKNLKNEVKKMIWHHDAPVNSMSVYAQWCVFKLAKDKKIKVMLDGQGSDELLAGYFDFFGIYWLDLIKSGNIIRLIKEMWGFKRNHSESPWAIFGRLFRNLANRGVFGEIIAKFFRRQNKQYEVFTWDFLNRHQNTVFPQPTRSNLKNSLYTSIKFGLPSLLKYEDRNSMAFAIESRIPFLDYRLVEYIFSLPAEFKIRAGQTKYLLRQAMKGVIPEKIRTRQDKIGFAIPGDVWLRGALKKDLQKVFRSKKFQERGFVEPEKAAKILDEFLIEEFKDYNLIWRLYNLELWFRLFIDPERK